MAFFTDSKNVVLHPVRFSLGCSFRRQRRPLFRQKVVPHGLEEQLLALETLPDQGLGVDDRHEEVAGDERQPDVLHQLERKEVL